MTYEQTEYTKPSLELFQEMIWDRTANLGMTDKEVNDLAIWCARTFLKYTYKEVEKFYDISRGSIEGIERRFKRRRDKPQGEVDLQNAALVLFAVA